MALATPLAMAAPLRPVCPAAQAPVHESLVRADCADCWSADDRPGKAGWRFDWIVPTAVDAPLAAAALPEAAERAARAASSTARGADRPRLQAGTRLRVVSGPAWNGYFGVQITLRAPARHPWPEGATAWMALVEQVPAGSDGSPVARSLVRAVAGPLPITASPTGQALRHLRALRWPEAAQPTRLQARAWVETADGEMLAVAADHCP